MSTLKCHVHHFGAKTEESWSAARGKIIKIIETSLANSVTVNCGGFECIRRVSFSLFLTFICNVKVLNLIDNKCIYSWIILWYLIAIYLMEWLNQFNKDICALKYLSFLSGPVFNTKNIYHPLFSNLEIFMLCNSTSVFLLQ